MNKIKLLAVIGASAITLQAFAAAPALKSNTDKLSYTIGYEMGHNFRVQAIKIEPNLVQQGIEDGLQGKQALLDEKARQATVVAFQKEVIAKQEKAFKSVASKNAKVGAAFLAANQAKTGVKTTKDGLQYKIIKVGTGAKPSLNDTVTVNYSGSFIDGKVFDSSYKRGKPAVFPLTQVIKGWQEALTMMPVGSTWEIYVPSKLAYGERGMGRVIGPNETLVFKIELIAIDKKKS